VLTCEHAGNRIPPEYAACFRGAAAVLASHRGIDLGALALARKLARRFGVPLHFVAWSRLLVESNRSPSNPRIWSRYTRSLPADARRRVMERYYWPHRREVETALRDALDAGRRVVHVAVHSFTPVLGGETRNADVGLLYDPRRPRERELALAWQEALREIRPGLRVRRNYPYPGVADGLATWLRRRLPDPMYAGFELEVSQAVLAGPSRRDAERALAESLARLLAAGRASERAPRGRLRTDRRPQRVCPRGRRS
jgi:predicted N-formylglutamate amidohydrolase